MIERVLVTYTKNVERHDPENPEADDDGFVLRDPKIWGHMLGSQLLPKQIQDENGVIHHGFELYAEVIWEHDRSLAKFLVPMSDLSWIKFGFEDREDDESADDDDQEDDDETEMHDGALEV